jgi:CRISPR system Cascade subunit CasD
MYLAQAAFLVVLAGDTDTIVKAHAAMHRPKRGVFFGRKSCTPSIPLVDGESVLDTSLEDVIATYPWIPFTTALTGASVRRMKRTHLSKTLSLRTVVDCPAGMWADTVIKDVPVSLVTTARTFATRGLSTGIVTIPNPFYEKNKDTNADTDTVSSHDPMEGMS